MLDVVLVTSAERDKLSDSLATWQEGDLEHSGLPRRRARVMELDWNGFDVHFDDETWPEPDQEPPAHTRIEVCVERNALVFVAPD